MTGNDPAGILHPVTALEHRFKQVANLSTRAEDETDPTGKQPGELRKPEEFCQECAGNPTDQTTDRPLDTLLRADRQVKTVFANGRTDEISDGIAQHHDQKDREDPFPPLRKGAQQNKMTDEEREIKEAKENRGTITGNGLDCAVMKEENGGNDKSGGSKCPGRQAVLQVKTRDQSSTKKRSKDALKTPGRRKSHAIKFIKGDKDNDGDNGAEKGRRGAPDQQKQQGEKDDPGNNALFNNKSP